MMFNEDDYRRARKSATARANAIRECVAHLNAQADLTRESLTATSWHEAATALQPLPDKPVAAQKEKMK